MATVHPQRQRVWLAQRPAASPAARQPAAVSRDTWLARLQAWWRSAVWPEAPVPQPAGRVGSQDLALAWYRTMHFAGAGETCATLDDLLAQARTMAALKILLDDFRAGKAQTPEERIVAESLDHVARTYLGA